jgi:hypothetical protein
MLHIDWESRANEKALPAILERRKLVGGRVVVFQRVVSFIFFTRLSSHYCLVQPHESPSIRGLLFFAPSFLTGWWSPSGFLYTCYALAHDLLGGIDVTDQIDVPTTPKDKRKEASFRRKRLALCIMLVIAILLPILAWLSLTLIK